MSCPAALRSTSPARPPNPRNNRPGRLIFLARRVSFSMKTITLATFNLPEEAEPLRHRLEENHIPAWVHRSGILHYLWFPRRRRAEIRLDVRIQDFYKSQRLLESMENQREAAADTVVHCPECHSSRVVFPQYTQKFFLPNLVGFLCGIGLVKKEFYCEDCHYTWTPEAGKPDRRHHLAPNYFLEGMEEFQNPPEPAEKSPGKKPRHNEHSALND